ncbi:ATP-dependent DNA ligase [Natronosporangium hydrolyticum]|uniref:ATP-dependent DNA ligase n=1 Tax=Natronosporangium hydrolyticum TaxID=2811111 RepID=A0A895YHD5_9ACTN|nr:DNA polymerase ligase N-terminal domain-containing protein [Natronosporangium hydrolyticum]QSB13128.1 ATP-dependent DNA ligase [Natronosporangium hydrolyticum]
MTADPASSAADQLAGYRRKRDFAQTPEPTGASPGTASQPRFVVQRHRARRLHYDLRLEIGGALASWAVPKGPTLDPAVRRAAFRVEDHPIEYLDFEGVIPADQYGGGDVIVWDAGDWRALEPDPAAALAHGELHFDLYGRKLRGRFVLVNTGRGDPDREQWLLLHKRDEFAVPGWEPEAHPYSVHSGRTNEQVKAAPERLWRSDLPADRAAVAVPAAADGTDTDTGAGAGAGADELRRLDDLGSAGTWEVFGRRLRVTNLDKVLFPPRPGEPPVTKRDLLRYAAQIAPVVLPYLTGRALNMHRFPDGAQEKGFWHKALPNHAPRWLPRWTNPEAGPGETRTYLVVDEPAALVWAANFGALEWHPWTSPVETPHQPTYALIDLDPGKTTSWQELLVLARLHRTALAHLGVAARAKVTGRRGIQIWVPVTGGPDFATTRAWAEQLSRAIGAVVPELVSWEWGVSERGGLARLDYTQNAVNKTLVAPYSPRPAPGAPVSAPIDWDELDEPGLTPDAFTIRTILPRLAARGDLFRDVLHHSQQLPPLR